MAMDASEHARINARLIEATRGLGRDLTADLLKRSQHLYAGLHESEPYGAIRLHRDLRYGPDPRHRLDIFEPDEPGRHRPVLLYVHGGGFVRGDKKNEGLPYFDNIGVWAARRGFLGITMTYRLAPQHRSPAAQDDVAAAIAWVRDNVGAFSGDPDRIILMGHSAGATLAACHLARGAVSAGIAGAVLASGHYDFSRLRNADNIRNYFGDDYTRHSPIDALLRSPVKLMIGAAEFDPWDFQDQALVLVKAIFERDGTLPRFVLQSGQNHYTSCFRIGFAPRDPIEVELEAFVSGAANEAP